MTTNSLDTFTPDELLQAAVAKGATLQQAMQQLVRMFAPEPTAAELAYVRAANKHLGDDTGLKFEDKAPVCIEGKSTDKLNALRAAVLANLTYWAAMRALEHALQPEKEFSDRASDRLVDFVDNLACGMPDPVSPQRVAEAVTEEELKHLDGQLRGL